MCEERYADGGGTFPSNPWRPAKLYLKTADFTLKRPCGIYRLSSRAGRHSYKILSGPEELLFLQKHGDKNRDAKAPLFSVTPYRECPNTQIRTLTAREAERCLRERQPPKRRGSC